MFQGLSGCLQHIPGVIYGEYHGAVTPLINMSEDILWKEFMRQLHGNVCINSTLHMNNANASGNRVVQEREILIIPVVATGRVFEWSSAVWGRYQYAVAVFVEKYRGYGKERQKLGNKNYRRKSRRKETWQNGGR
jgi:hypothetical protein